MNGVFTGGFNTSRTLRQCSAYIMGQILEFLSHFLTENAILLYIICTGSICFWSMLRYTEGFIQSLCRGHQVLNTRDQVPKVNGDRVGLVEGSRPKP